MAKITVAIPSYKRPDNVLAYETFENSLIVIPESQRDDYVKHYDHRRIIAIPDDCDGAQPRKRNWILKNLPRPLVVVDDDVRRIVTTEGIYDSKGNFTGSAQQMKPLSRSQVTGLLEHGFNLANEWGCVLWGLNVNTDGRNYQQYKPFSLTQIILGPFFAHLNHDILYDDRLPFKSDYDLCLQVMHKHKKALRLNKYAYDCDHGQMKGGNVAIRTLAKETECARFIEAKWGRSVINYPPETKKYGDILNGRVHIPIAGV